MVVVVGMIWLYLSLLYWLVFTLRIFNFNKSNENANVLVASAMDIVVVIKAILVVAFSVVVI